MRHATYGVHEVAEAVINQSVYLFVYVLECKCRCTHADSLHALQIFGKSNYLQAWRLLQQRDFNVLLCDLFLIRS